MEKALSGETALDLINAGKEINLAIVDLTLPGINGLELFERIRTKHPEISVIILTATGGVEHAVKAIKMGAVDYLEKSTNPETLLLVIKKEYECRKLHLMNMELTEGLDRKTREYIEKYQLVGDSEPMKSLRHEIIKTAKHNVSLLITGESGTGKENTAHLIHYYSDKRHRPMMKVNCAALSPDLIESELFGHVKGAFTGAIYDKAGRIESANGGTLFLDEVGDIPLRFQIKLLRVLQSKEFERVGSAKTMKSEFRLITATNRDLMEKIEQGKFRMELYYRINVKEIKIPPLREHIEDMPLLLKHLLIKFSEKHNIYIEKFSDSAINELMSHNWPGNVRELENVVECAVVNSQDAVIELEDLLNLSNYNGNGMVQKYPPTMNLAENEKRIIEASLSKTRNNRTKAAKMLGISRTTLISKIRRLALD